VSVEEIQSITSYDVILFGCNRVGYDFIEAFKHMNSQFLAIDYDPDTVMKLQNYGINIKYGDADDGEFLDYIKANEAKAVISTIPDYETNLFILEKTKNINPKLI